ncbi:hypothetical protein GH714_015295 [Hevea brasiliensis]|uniref:Peptidase A1 domain-containing protein n=1 Tax=Hevea brasiliensis TaxID=3981 RepID=A0A6A6LH10_HEVBR|nr:hypothetical protein GH714_015295 [Hevea brasiliensis]
MAVAFPVGIVIAAVLSHVTLVLSSFPATLTLERGIPPSHRLELNQLRERDSFRHRRILQSAGGVVDFPVQGTFNPFLVGLYYTKVQLGSPPKDFYVQIDTGVMFCGSVAAPAMVAPLQVDSNSSTASLISCSDQRCTVGIQSSDSLCSSQSNQCGYTFQYGDGSGTSGYYVADFLHFDTVLGGSVTNNSSAAVVFGCSTLQTGDLTKSDRAVDGIFGFGQQDMSVISQLASQGITPKVFSHCLKGDDAGGGVLVLGEIVEPNIVYTPLVPTQPHYNLNLQSISVNGQTLAIDSSVFATSSNQGTIVDSGTTLAYLAEAAYDPFVNAGGAAVWCIGFQKTAGQEITILGDLVLKDKIFVYDIANQRLGWTNYDCSMSVNVSTTTNTGKSEFVNTGNISNNSSPRNVPYKLISITMTILLNIFTLGSYLFL